MSVGTPPLKAFPISANAWAADIQLFAKTYPACLGSNENEQMNQKFYVMIGSSRFDLTTIINIQRGSFNGQLKVDENITTPWRERIWRTCEILRIAASLIVVGGLLAAWAQSQTANPEPNVALQGPILDSDQGERPFWTPSPGH